MNSLATAVSRLYNATVRRVLPRKIASLNGVPVRYVKFLDATDTFPEYEASLVASIREWVDGREQAVIVGGGAGVSTVVTARYIDIDGSVTVYEASSEQANLVAETVVLNNVAPTVRVRQAVVGENRSVWGTSSDSSVVAPEELPPCDVLVMDCEGAESVILKSMTVEPDMILVETHGHLESPTSTVRSLLAERGYDVVDEKTEIEELGVDVLTAVRRGQEST